MLRSLKNLEKYSTSATDGPVGEVVNFLLDDERWAIRYLVVETGTFFAGHEVLISPVSFGAIEWDTRQFHLALTMEKIKGSPAVETDRPVSRQREREHFLYYGYPKYWGSSGVWGMAPIPAGLMPGNLYLEASGEPDPDDGDIHLRSAKELRGYSIQGTDEVIGHVQDFIVDDLTWEIRYLVIDISQWGFGKAVLVSPHWASSISWDQRQVHMDLTRQEIQDCPRWNPSAGVNREYEVCLYDYFGRPAYWSGDDQDPGTPAHNLPGKHRGSRPLPGAGTTPAGRMPTRSIDREPSRSITMTSPDRSHPEPNPRIAAPLRPKGDFATGQEQLPASGSMGDFALGEHTLPSNPAPGDFATGQHALPTDTSPGGFATVEPAPPVAIDPGDPASAELQPPATGMAGDFASGEHELPASGTTGDFASGEHDLPASGTTGDFASGEHDLPASGTTGDFASGGHTSPEKPRPRVPAASLPKAPVAVPPRT